MTDKKKTRFKIAGAIGAGITALGGIIALGVNAYKHGEVPDIDVVIEKISKEQHIPEKSVRNFFEQSFDNIKRDAKKGVLTNLKDAWTRNIEIRDSLIIGFRDKFSKFIHPTGN